MKIENMNLEHLHKIENVLENEFDNFWNYNILKSELESENSKYIVAIEDSAVLGFAGILILPDLILSLIKGIPKPINKLKRGPDIDPDNAISLYPKFTKLKFNIKSDILFP